MYPDSGGLKVNFPLTATRPLGTEKIEFDL
jgi:hypothetical protein